MHSFTLIQFLLVYPSLLMMGYPLLGAFMFYGGSISMLLNIYLILKRKMK